MSPTQRWRLWSPKCWLHGKPVQLYETFLKSGGPRNRSFRGSPLHRTPAHRRIPRVPPYSGVTYRHLVYSPFNPVPETRAGYALNRNFPFSSTSSTRSTRFHIRMYTLQNLLCPIKYFLNVGFSVSLSCFQLCAREKRQQPSRYGEQSVVCENNLSG